jgi:hypothetical protein
VHGEYMNARKAIRLILGSICRRWWPKFKY